MATCSVWRFCTIRKTVLWSRWLTATSHNWPWTILMDRKCMEKLSVSLCLNIRLCSYLGRDSMTKVSQKILVIPHCIVLRNLDPKIFRTFFLLLQPFICPTSPLQLQKRTCEHCLPTRGALWKHLSFFKITKWPFCRWPQWRRPSRPWSTSTTTTWGRTTTWECPSPSPRSEAMESGGGRSVVSSPSDCSEKWGPEFDFFCFFVSFFSSCCYHSLVLKRNGVCKAGLPTAVFHLFIGSHFYCRKFQFHFPFLFQLSWHTCLKGKVVLLFCIY